MNQPSNGLAGQRDVVVIGASAGGIEPLIALVGRLPADLAAAVFVVVHTPPTTESRLPQILARSGELPASHAEDGERIVPGRIYVAPPDRHLLVRRGTMEVTRGPRENHSRPAIDPLFRSAARAYGPRTVGVILSGALYDGVAGLLAIKERGGVAVVQDPGEAMVPSMPQRALALVDADMVLPAADIGDALTQLGPAELDLQETDTMVDGEERLKGVIAKDFSEQAHDDRVDAATVYTCPDCGGVLWQAEQGRDSWFRCHVGHAYAPEALLGQKSEEVEAALWNCVRLLRERATLTRQSAARYEQLGHKSLAVRSDEQALADERHADVLRELLEQMPGPVDVPIPTFGPEGSAN